MARGAQYATTEDGLHIAFVTEGDGEPLVWIPHYFSSHVELEWDFPQCHIYRSLSERCMVVRFDGRGLGLSTRDGVRDVSATARMRDLDAVMARLGFEQFALAGVQGGGNLAVAYATEHPESVTKLVLLNWTPNFTVDSDRARMASLRELLERDWELFTENVGGVTFGYSSPYAKGYGRLIRASITQKMAIRYGLELLEDCTPLLSRVRSETLMLHSEESAYASAASARRASAAIADCRLRVFEGELTSHVDGVVEAIATFVAPAAIPTPSAADGRASQARTGAALSPRELDVLLLVAGGRSNQQIAGALGLSPRTVERHLENLYRKTGSRSRAEAAAYAAAHGLLPP